MIEDRIAREVFDSLVHITVGMGDKVLFWRDRWIHGFAVADIAPLLLATVHTRVVNTRTVQQALLNDSWMEDCQAEISFMAHMQCMHLCHALATVNRNAAEQDVFTWMCSASGQYSSKSVYSSLCNGWPKSPMAKCVWRSWAPLKCKLFV
jgi:hypothetical protein